MIQVDPINKTRAFGRASYLADVFDRIHDHPNKQLAQLLPWHWKPKIVQTAETAAA